MSVIDSGLISLIGAWSRLGSVEAFSRFSAWSIPLFNCACSDSRTGLEMGDFRVGEEKHFRDA